MESKWGKTTAISLNVSVERHKFFFLQVILQPTRGLETWKQKHRISPPTTSMPPLFASDLGIWLPFLRLCSVSNYPMFVQFAPSNCHLYGQKYCSSEYSFPKLQVRNFCPELLLMHPELQLILDRRSLCLQPSRHPSTASSVGLFCVGCLYSPLHAVIPFSDIFITCILWWRRGQRKEPLPATGDLGHQH